LAAIASVAIAAGIIICLGFASDNSLERQVREMVGENAVVYAWQITNIERGLPADEPPVDWSSYVAWRLGFHRTHAIAAIDLKFCQRPIDQSVLDAIAQLKSVRLVAIDCDAVTPQQRTYLKSLASGRFEVLDRCIHEEEDSGKDRDDP
jgi:hypothetical protein